MSTFTPVDSTKITKKERYNVLAPLMFLTKKQNGVIKDQGCVDGRKQLEVITRHKEGLSSPTVSLKRIMITCDI